MGNASAKGSKDEFTFEEEATGVRRSVKPHSPHGSTVT